MLNAANLPARAREKTLQNQKTLKSILIVGSDEHHRMLLGALLSEEGHTVLTCGSSIEALNRLQQGGIQFVIIDHLPPELNGLSLLKRIKERNLTVPVLFISARYEVEPYLAAVNLGALDYLGKPIDYADIQRIVDTHESLYSRTKRKYNVVLDED